MGFDKEGSKNGVGGFFNLFDWTAKSRKKLFSNKSDLPDNKQGKRSDGNLPKTRLSLIDDDEIGFGASFKGSGDFSCASSVTDEDGFGGTRAPSVVARLMGLDSLPNSNLQEPYSTPYFDTRSLQDVHFQKKNFEYYNSGNFVKKSGGQSSRSFVEPKPKKSTTTTVIMTPSRPIEKFQTEILPPKSAKSIPVTHHKLLSPIKSPGFVPSNDAARIMEAAAKIIDHGPQLQVKAKMPLAVGSSSVPLKVQALREKVEATQKANLNGSSSSSSAKSEAVRRVKPVESNAAKFLRGQSMTKSWNGSVDMSFKPFLDKEEEGSCSGSKNTKGKSISLAIQAKVNVQKREGLSSSASRSEASDRQLSEAKSSSPTFRSQQSTQKGLNNNNKPSTRKSSSGVLRQNNQKQNSQVDKDSVDNSVSKPLVSNSQSRKLLSRDQKGSNRSGSNTKSGPRKSILSGDGEKDAPYSSARNFPRKKRSNPSSEKSPSVTNQKPVKASAVTDCYNWAEESKKKGIDVVSFTFTAPLTRPTSGSESTGKRVLVDSDGMKLSSLGYNVIGGDALSLLLEEKLRELTFGLESSGSASTSASHLENVVAEKKDSFSDQFEFGFSTTGPKQSLQGLSKMDESISPVSILEPSFSNESCDSSLTMDSHNTEGAKLCCSSVQAQEVNTLTFPKKLNPLEADTELSDSASSIISATVIFDPTKYVKEILSNVELMFNEFALGRSSEIINPHLFDLLECRKRPFESDNGCETRLRKKALFDCVSELVNLRCKQCVGGGFKKWTKGVEMVRRKEHLVEQVRMEISGWEKLSDSMVDELVDKDMSCQFGKWVDFEADEVKLGVDLEALIFDSLVDEIVADMI